METVVRRISESNRKREKEQKDKARQKGHRQQKEEETVDAVERNISKSKKEESE